MGRQGLQVEEHLFSKAGSGTWFQPGRSWAGTLSQPPGLIGRLVELDLCPLRGLRWDSGSCRWSVSSLRAGAEAPGLARQSLAGGPALGGGDDWGGLLWVSCGSCFSSGAGFWPLH